MQQDKHEGYLSTYTNNCVPISIEITDKEIKMGK